MKPPRPPVAQRLTLSVDEAAGLLGVAPRTLRSMIAAGTFPTLRIGRRVLVPRAGLDAWIAARQADPNDAA